MSNLEEFIKNIEEQINAFGDFLEKEVKGGFQLYSATNSTSGQFGIEPYNYNKKTGGEGDEFLSGPNITDSLYVDLKNTGVLLTKGRPSPNKSPISVNGNHVVSLVKLSAMYSRLVPKRIEHLRNVTFSNDVFLLVEKTIGPNKCYGTLITGDFSTKMRVSFFMNSENEITIAPLKKWMK